VLKFSCYKDIHSVPVGHMKSFLTRREFEHGIFKAELLNVEKTRISADSSVDTSRQGVTSQRACNFILAVLLYLSHNFFSVCVCVCKGSFRFFPITGFQKFKYLPYSNRFLEHIKYWLSLGQNSRPEKLSPL
jgi:hypothetical protein